MEKTARAKGNYQDMETAKNVQRSRSLFRRFKVEGKGYSPDIFSELQREPTQLTKAGTRVNNCKFAKDSSIRATLFMGEVQ